MEAERAIRLAAMVRKETIINTAATAVIAALLSWAIFRGQQSIVPIAPPVGGILGIVPGTFNFTLLVTLALTVITRRRIRAGLYTKLDGETRGLAAVLPANVLLRALLLALLATLALVPLTVALITASMSVGWLPQSWSFFGMLLFFVAYFSLLSWLVTPIILWRAVRD